MARLLLWVRPGGRSDALDWDRWRGRWVVTCRAPPSEGAANRAVAELLAGWLGVPRDAVRWERAGSSRAKVLVIDGMTEAEAERRLRSALPEGGLRRSRQG